MNRIIYVGIAGKKRHGKDTVAGFIRDHLADAGCTVARRGFSCALKEEVAEFLAPRLAALPQWGPSEEQVRRRLLRDLNFGDEQVKEPFRLLMQWWGVEYRRQMCSSDYWLRQLELWVNEESRHFRPDTTLVVLVPDLRMPNECQFIRNRNGLLIKVFRPELESADTHATETALDGYEGWDRLILNDGTLEDLRKWTSIFCESMLEPRL